MARIGIAIVIPDPYAEQLRRWRASFEDVGSHPVPPHVTLLAPTEVPDQVLPAMDRHLECVARKVGPFPMRLSGSGTFRPVSPVVFVNVAEGADAVRATGVTGPVGPAGRTARVSLPPARHGRP